MSAISCTINLSVCGNSLTLCWAQSMWIYLANVYSLQRICHPLVPPSDFCHIHLGSPDTLIGSLILRLDIQKHDTVLVLFHQPRSLEKKNHDHLRREPYCTLAVRQVGQLWNGSLHEFWKFHEVCNFRWNILHDLVFCTKRLALKGLDFIIFEVFPFNSHSRTNTWLQVSFEEANSNFSRQVAHCQLGYRRKILPALHTKDQCTLWSSIISISETYPTNCTAFQENYFFHLSEKSFSNLVANQSYPKGKKNLQKHQTIESNHQTSDLQPSHEVTWGENSEISERPGTHPLQFPVVKWVGVHLTIWWVFLDVLLFLYVFVLLFVQIAIFYTLWCFFCLKSLLDLG